MPFRWKARGRINNRWDARSCTRLTAGTHTRHGETRVLIIVRIAIPLKAHSSSPTRLHTKVYKHFAPANKCSVTSNNKNCTRLRYHYCLVRFRYPPKRLLQDKQHYFYGFCLFSSSLHSTRLSIFLMFIARLMALSLSPRTLLVYIEVQCIIYCRALSAPVLAANKHRKQSDNESSTWRRPLEEPRLSLGFNWLVDPQLFCSLSLSLSVSSSHSAWLMAVAVKVNSEMLQTIQPCRANVDVAKKKVFLFTIMVEAINRRIH